MQIPAPGTILGVWPNNEVSECLGVQAAACARRDREEGAAESAGM